MSNKDIGPRDEQVNQSGKNAGSTEFNQGSEGDPDHDKGVRVSDHEKRTGHSNPEGAPKQNSDRKRKNKRNDGGPVGVPE